jgi:hypothetical protein
VTATSIDSPTKRQRRIVREPSPIAAAAVERVRQELGIATLADIDVVLIGARYGLVPRVADLENEEAHLLRMGERGLVCVSRRVWETGTWRFPYAHEIGHWLTDRGHDDFPRCTSESRRGARRLPERFASDFAGLLLVPDGEVTAGWDLRAPGLDTVSAIARACGVGVATAALRVLQMTKAPRAVAQSKGGTVEWWAETAAFGARVRAARAVPRGSEAARLGGVGAEGGRSVTEAWDAERVPSQAVKVWEEGVVVSWLG